MNKSEMFNRNDFYPYLAPTLILGPITVLIDCTQERSRRNILKVYIFHRHKNNALSKRPSHEIEAEVGDISLLDQA